MKRRKSESKSINIFSLDPKNEFTDLDEDDLKETGDLTRLSTFLGRGLLADCRLAQSVMTRSEAELFGISSPRFATRIYLDRGGFLNYRRLSRLIKNIPKLSTGLYGTRYPDGNLPEKHRNSDLKSQPLSADITPTGCIADSILPAPDRLVDNNYRFISVDNEKLFKTYTEEFGPSESQAKFTPFVRPTELGGGQCAQAACFVATASLAKYAKSLCGIAEITAYAHSDECCELSLSGLTPFKMQRYFKRVGLSMSQQSITKGAVASVMGEERQDLANALRCYLHSDMPVIFPVDCREMQKQNVYLDNACQPKKRITEKQAHVVTLMGYRVENDWFTFHDPAAFPYMTTQISQLAEVGCERDDGIDLPDNGVFMPVTPAEVRMPLGWERRQEIDGGKFKTQIGLLTISTALFDKNRFIFPRKDSNSKNKTPFILGKHLDVSKLSKKQTIVNQKLSENVNKLLLKIKKKRKWKSDKWMWFQVFDEGVMIWDAELDPPTNMPETAVECHKFLVGIVNSTGNNKYEQIEVGKYEKR